MGILDGAIVTVNGVARTYRTGYVARYAAELSKGNTAVAKCDVTGGSSILRVSHDESKGTARHLISVEDEVTDSDGVVHFQKAHIVVACEAGNPTQESETEFLVEGLNALVGSGTFMSDVLDGLL